MITMNTGGVMRRIFEQKCRNFIKDKCIVCSLLLAVLVLFNQEVFHVVRA
jgi:hypothetical protein